MRKTASSPRIAYDVAGDRGPAVALVMGLGMRGRAWAPQVEGLRGDHRLLFYDHRGVGDSERGGGRFSMADLAEDLARILDELAWEAVHLVGTSMGGMVVQEAVLRTGSRVKSLTLIATHPGGPFGWVPTPRGLARALRAIAGRRAHRDERFARVLYDDAFLSSLDPDARRRYVEPTGNLTTDLDTLKAHAAAVIGFDTRSRLGTIRVPTLVIRPGRDLVVRPAGSDTLAGRIPGARIVRLDAAGHSVTSQDPAAVTGALRAHVAAAERG